MRIGLSRIARRLAGNERGASVIEMALVAPLFGAVVMGTVDVAIGFTERLGLESAAHRTIEMVTARGQVGSDYSYLRTEAANASGRPESDVTIDNWLECDEERQDSFTGSCDDDETIARYVSVRIEGEYDPMFLHGPVALALGDGSDVIEISGDAVVRVQ